MQARQTKTPWPCQRPLVAALAALASCGAWADEPTPWYVGASQTLTHDSNVYRLPNGAGDTYSSTGLLGGFDQSIGRQHFAATANLKYNKYNEQTTLNNTSYGLNAGWDWTSIENLSGSLNLAANQNLATFDGNATIPTSGRNILKTEAIAANVRWGGTGVLSLQTDYAHNRVHYTAPEYLSAQSSADSGSLGAYYNVGPTLKLGTAVRLTRTVSPYGFQSSPGVYESTSSNGRNLDLSADWRYSPQTGVSARLSWTRQSNSGSSGQDFSGITGALSANYAPTAKLSFNAGFNRDTGTNASLFNIGGGAGTTPVPAQYQNSTISNSLSLGAAYAATAKISVNTGYMYRHSRNASTLSAGGGSANVGDYTDNVRSASLGVNYAIARAWQLSCNLSHETRSTTSASSFGYSANVAGCTATLTLR
ncbi:MAG: hypothetical protein ABI781_13525 [Burkholderiales bacterium]